MTEMISKVNRSAVLAGTPVDLDRPAYVGATAPVTSVGFAAGGGGGVDVAGMGGDANFAAAAGAF
ncbi:hypothetical protein HWD35_08655 [Tsukamurella tyrosinosolvens]|uniref:Uncharacterized protein n=1 Tax=Tsukamurella tyrosinosolvens TaxID=57704 RepID=A0A1H5A951_TSUTY|nr:hypothetical protein [Tsukamurella tyrosinosolvens]KXO95403.1 hypothetical protein AXK58_11860 [Tsukamurella tyrosinosolvens]KXP07377.1 hypothetical protein AXK59_04685 [Tsukamurella tyrosinosolvens]KZL98578.1 hypothetical protein AXX05_06835 [Tsukamurella tyrosinosolvens]MCA4994778.1 hypothetical protein [Tsukamurella tyrosinosolvens]MEC4614720.1 hypothetical protein [Tsukamurella tyrosinosolvens]